jgi:DNA mismatch endonuclease, patch repair protein
MAVHRRAPKRARAQRPDLKRRKRPAVEVAVRPRESYPSLRSWTMSRIRSKNTKPEMAVRKVAHAAGLRFRLHRKDLPGTPDLVFPSRSIALFVHGCFWHRHHCTHATSPATNADYWAAKFDRNVRRDARNASELRKLGWRCVRIWECETKNANKLAGVLRRKVAAMSVKIRK